MPWWELRICFGSYIAMAFWWDIAPDIMANYYKGQLRIQIMTAIYWLYDTRNGAKLLWVPHRFWVKMLVLVNMLCLSAPKSLLYTLLCIAGAGALPTMLFHCSWILVRLPRRGRERLSFFPFAGNFHWLSPVATICPSFQLLLEFTRWG